MRGAGRICCLVGFACIVLLFGAAHAQTVTVALSSNATWPFYAGEAVPLTGSVDFAAVGGAAPTDLRLYVRPNVAGALSATDTSSVFPGPDPNGFYEIAWPSPALPQRDIALQLLLQQDHAGVVSFDYFVAYALGDATGETELQTAITPDTPRFHPADQDGNWGIGLAELLRVIQFYNASEISCSAGSEDGYAPGPGAQTCRPYAADTNRDWDISLFELLRVIQFYNSLRYYIKPGTEDSYASALFSVSASPSRLEVAQETTAEAKFYLGGATLNELTLAGHVEDQSPGALSYVGRDEDDTLLYDYLADANYRGEVWVKATVTWPYQAPVIFERLMLLQVPLPPVKPVINITGPHFAGFGVSYFATVWYAHEISLNSSHVGALATGTATATFDLSKVNSVPTQGEPHEGDIPPQKFWLYLRDSSGEGTVRPTISGDAAVNILGVTADDAKGASYTLGYFPPPYLSAELSSVDGHYVAGNALNLSLHVESLTQQPFTAFGITLEFPEGWSTPAGGEVCGALSTLDREGRTEFLWITPPAFPLQCEITVAAPPDAYLPVTLRAMVTYRLGDSVLPTPAVAEISLVAQPDPLPL